MNRRSQSRVNGVARSGAAPYDARVRRRLHAVTLSAALGAVAVGCAAGAAHAPGPADALARYAHALETGDAGAAYDLLDDGARARFSRERFVALMRDNAAEMREQGALMSAQAARDVPARALVRLGDDERVVLALGPAGWRLEGGVLDAPALTTPEDAIAALRRALRRRDLASLLRVLSRQTRAELEADIARVAGATEDELDLEIDVQGDRATVRTTGGGRIELVREGAEWRVRDIE